MSRRTLIQTFLSIPAFDQKYWESDLRQTIEDIIDNFKDYDLFDVLRSLEVPTPEDPIKLSLYYYLYALYITHLPYQFDWMKKAADLGNPYAMLYITDHSEDETEIQKYIKMAYKAYSPIATVQYIINYITDEYKVKEIEEINDQMHEMLENSKLLELEARIIADLSRISKAKCEEITNSIVKIYTFLDNEASTDKYIDQLMYYKLRNNDLEYRNGLRENVDEIGKIIRRNLQKKERISELEKEVYELKKAYAELKKLKELDFNNLIGNQVGEYLADS